MVSPEKPKNPPNVKIYISTDDKLNYILKHIDGYLDNKKLLLAVSVKRVYDEFLSIDLRKNSDVEKFVTKLFAEIHEMQESNEIDIDIRPKARKRK
jgi:hypothetical protein